MKVVTDNKHYNNIAAAIREKTAAENTYTPAEMASGVNEVYEAGKKTQHKEFMDCYISNFPKTREGIFKGEGWNAKTFYPTKDFTIYKEGFMYHNNSVYPAYDLAERLNECGVKMTINHPTSIFENAHFSRLPEIDVSAFGNTSLYRLCYGMSFLVTIDKLNIGKSRSAAIDTGIFGGCKKLENIIIDGIINNDFKISSSPLSVASVISILTHLKNYAGTSNAGTYTVTLSDTSKNAMAATGTLEELDSKTYDAYIADKGWNLA